MDKTRAKKITIELSDEDHKRFVNAKMDLRLKSLQELMIVSTAAYLTPSRETRKEGDTDSSTPASPTGQKILPATPVREITYGSSLGPTLDSATPQEQAYLVRTLRIIRSPAGAALRSNIDQFDALAGFYERFGGSAPAPSETLGHGTSDAEIDRALDRAQKAVELVERLGRDAAGSESGKVRPHAKTRKRRKA